MTQGEKVGRGGGREAIRALDAVIFEKIEGVPWLAKHILAAIREGKVPGVRLAPSVGPDPRDQWYPGADGVQTVQELWAYYCERGDQMAEVADLREHLAQSERECMEQARLNGMGSEREARLMAEVAELRGKVGDAQREIEVLRENIETAMHGAGELKAERDEARGLLKSLRLKHHECDDPWYSCPKADNPPPLDANLGTECLCGADEHNAKIDAFLGASP